MRTTRRSCTSLWILLAAIGAGSGAGCGGDDDGSGGVDGGTAADAGTEAGPALDELGAALSEALCPRMFDCCTSADLDEVFEEETGDEPTDVPSCVTAVTTPLDEIVAELADSVAAGRLQYSAGRMDLCLRAIGDISCESFAGVLDDLTAFSACEEPPFTALVADGATCASDLECESGFCARDGDAVDACAALPGEGDACPDSRCADGTYCDDIGATCLAQKQDGQACSAADECRSGDCVDDICGASPICDGQG